MLFIIIFVVIIVVYYCQCFSHFHCAMGAWAALGYGGWGLMAGLWVGQAFGVLLLPGFGVGSSNSSPQVPDDKLRPDKTLYLF